jgi:hypothetical protein
MIRMGNSLRQDPGLSGNPSSLKFVLLLLENAVAIEYTF